MNIDTLYHFFSQSTGICTDTRTIKKGCLFICLKGDNFDGNKFAQDALDKGALKVLIDAEEYHKSTGETILCDDSLTALQELAAHHRQKLKTPIVALTGSNGKTTTKELIAAVLSQKFNTVATKGNLNNHIGVPLTLLALNATTQIAVVEMGANHLREIEHLCSIASPDYGYITNFGKAHLEGFGSMEGVIQGKTELYKYLEKHHKVVFVNGNDDTQLKHSENIKRFTFGDNQQECHIELEVASNRLRVRYNQMEIQTNLVGKYNFNNIAAAIAIGDYFKVTPEKIKTAIEGYVPTNNRSQLLEKGVHKIILDAYNANPTSMMAALENFKQTEGEPKILFLGDMFELGDEAETEHGTIASFLAENAIGKTFLIGSNFYKTSTEASHIQKFETFEQLKAYLSKTSLTPSLILIKASRGMALERILELL